MLINTQTAQPLTFHFLGSGIMVSNSLSKTLRPRFSELLFLMLIHPGGIDVQELTDQIYGEETCKANLAVEIHRLNKIIPLSRRPYRILQPWAADFIEIQNLIEQGEVLKVAKSYTAQILPRTDSPAIADYRTYLHESVKNTILQSGNQTAMWHFLNHFGDDIEVCQALEASTQISDPKRNMILARLKLVKRRFWGQGMEAVV